MSLALVVVFLCLVLFVANRAERHPTLRPGLFALLGFINAGIILFYGVLPFSQATRTSTISRQAATNGLILAIIVAGIASAVLLEPVRQRIARLLPASRSGGFNPASLTHMIGLVYCVYMVGDTVLEYTLAGGLSGLAKGFQAPTPVDLIVQMLAFLSVAFIGTGLLTRRSLPEVLNRLGLRAPTIQELWIGGIGSLALIGLMFFINAAWTSFTPIDTVQQQTQLSDLISQGVTTMTFAVFLAGTAAIGEEIAFRGALQPIFGLWPTALIFALTHIQYTLTPAALIILGVGVGLGFLRRRYNTTVAIVTHFLYDFILLMLPIYFHYLQASGALGP